MAVSFYFAEHLAKAISFYLPLIYKHPTMMSLTYNKIYI